MEIRFQKDAEEIGDPDQQLNDFAKKMKEQQAEWAARLQNNPDEFPYPVFYIWNPVPSQIARFPRSPRKFFAAMPRKVRASPNTVELRPSTGVGCPHLVSCEQNTPVYCVCYQRYHCLIQRYWG